MDKAQIFLPITKVDATLRMVYGEAAAEKADKTNEIFDYTTSKPRFEKWSEAIAKTTKGKSVGNVRAMHGKVAAGKLTTIEYDDVGKSIQVAAKIVDDQEWLKVQEGVYTGFSIGGAYAKTWTDPDNPALKRYTCEPSEISIVDNPCMYGSHFTMVKADGVEAEVDFKVYDPTNDEIAAHAGVLAKMDEHKGKGMPDLMELAREELVSKKVVAQAESEGPAQDPDTVAAEEGTENAEAILEHVKAPRTKEISDPPSAGRNDDAERAAGAGDDIAKDAETKTEDAPIDWGIAQVFKVGADGAVFATKAEAKAHVEALKAVKAMPAGPLTKALEEAMAAARAAAPAEKVEGAEDSEGSKVGAALKALADLAEANGVQKGIYQVRELASIVSDLGWLTSSTAYEAKAEGDGSAMPSTLAELLRGLGAALVDMAKEEVAELLASLTTAGVDIEVLVLEASAAKGGIELVKADTDRMEKAGKRNSAADASKIQAMHDHAAALGAKCDDSTGKGAPAEDLAKVVAENTALKADAEAALPQIEAMGKALTKALEGQAELLKRLETMEAAPRPLPTIRTVGKGADDPAGAATTTTEEPGSDLERLQRLADKVGPEGLSKIVWKTALGAPRNLLPGAPGSNS